MKTIAAGLLSFLQSNRQMQIADCYTFTLLGGSVLRVTTWDTNLTVSSNLFTSQGSSATAPLIERTKVGCKVGLTSDTLEITIHAGTAITLGGVPILQAVQSGALDGATVQLDRAFMDYTGAVQGSITIFYGMVGETRSRRASADITVNDMLHVLDTQLPKNTIQPSCWNELFDNRCTLNKASYAVSGHVVTVQGNQVITTNLTQADSYFSLGQLLFTSGNGNGKLLTVKTYVNASGTINFVAPLAFTVNAGDTFTAYPGCDKTSNTCNTKFSNLLHYNGAEFVPPPETAYA